MNERTREALDEIVWHASGHDPICLKPEHLLQILQKHGISLVLEPQGFSQEEDGTRPTYSVHFDEKDNVRVKLA